MSSASRPRVTVIGPNPAIDRIIDVPGLRLGSVSRSSRYMAVAGGKPMNVARTLSGLGTATRLILPLERDGRTRRAFLETASGLGIRLDAVGISGETRTCIILVDTVSGSATVVNESGPLLTESESADLERMSLSALDGCDLAVGSGSLPPGLAASFYGMVAAQARRMGVRFLLDTAGGALSAGMSGKPWAIKVNKDELLDVVGTDNVVEAAKGIRLNGVEHVVVTLGAGGCIYVGEEGLLRVVAPEFEQINPIGAGDVFAGGLVAHLAEGCSWSEALRHATALAALAASLFQPDIGPRPNVGPFLSRTMIEPL